MDDKNLIYSDWVEYGNVGSKQGLLYCFDKLSSKKYVVIILDFISDGINAKDSLMKVFSSLKEAEIYYEEELTIIIDKKEEIKSKKE